MNNIEQRYSIKFCVKLNKTATETFQLIQEAYGLDALSRTQVFEWHKRFRGGLEEVEDKQREGRPQNPETENIVAQIEAIIREDPRQTVRRIGEAVGISKSNAHRIMTEDLGMSRVCCRWVPRLLTIQMKDNRVACCNENLNRRFHEGLDFLNRIITGDETWLYFYDPETKSQSSIWKLPDTPTPLKPRRERSAGKIMAIIFFDARGIVYRHLVPNGQTVNASYYIDVLRSLNDAVRKKRPELHNRGWMVLHDNAPCHTATIVQNFLHANNIEQLSHPPYSPDLAPCDFWLFPNLKKPLRGTRFEDSNALDRASAEVLKQLSKDGLLFVFEKWCDRMRKCVQLGGGYVEKEQQH